MADNPKITAALRDKSAEDKASERRDLNADLGRLEGALSDLKQQYEQYFAGILTLAPDRLHGEVKRALRHLKRAPFRNSALNYRLRALEQRYHTFNSYWQRVLKQREEGTYCKDVFKANMRERFALEDARAETALGRAERNMAALFEAYRAALEKQTGKLPNLKFEVFQKSLIRRAKDFREKHPDKKLAFKIVVKDSKVTVQAKIRE